MPISPPLAVIDLGTNTFHLLIVRPDGSGQFETLCRERFFVKLAEEGIERIGDAALGRAYAALVHFAEKLAEHGVDKVRAFGTAGLRSASNGPDFVARVRAELGIAIQTISGDEEARLIHLGVMRALPPMPGRFLIMDIGGGSVEFIIADDAQVFWAQSFPIGVGLLYRRFHRSEPIAEGELIAQRAFLAEVLTPLRLALAAFPVQHLVGASGTFEVVEAMIKAQSLGPWSSFVPIRRFHETYAQIVPLDLAQRFALPHVPPDRAEMIVVALDLIRLILDMAAPKDIIVSAFALKEGMLHDMLSQPTSHTSHQ